jgi:AbiJ N-terminal domain 4
VGNPFSRRHGFRARVPITVREDAPATLRAGLLGILDDMGFSYSGMRDLICPVLHEFPNPNNWSEVPNIRDEVYSLVQNCDWFRIYDIAEAAYQHFVINNQAANYAGHLNALFEDLGIGWQMLDGQIVTRGDQEFEIAVAHAAVQIEAAGLRTAKSELDEARADLSRRPEPDLTGTVQHCVAALECVARTVSGDDRATLGEIIQRHAAEIGIPRPLDIAIERMWGYASEMARHLREGRVPAREEAEFLLSVSASIIAYLLQKNRRD